jgi:hypothetical protein
VEEGVTSEDDEEDWYGEYIDHVSTKKSTIVLARTIELKEDEMREKEVKRDRGWREVL